MSKPHHFSGWPGAFCLDCGAEDANELAIYEPDYHLCIEWEWEHPGEHCLIPMEDRNTPCEGSYNMYCGQCLTADTSGWYSTQS
jgi:hypothetical protein